MPEIDPEIGPAEYPAFKMSAGAKSFTQFLLVMVTAIPAFVWVSTRPYAGPDGDGTNFLMGFLLFLFWFPLIFASFCYGLIAIVENKGRIKGAITLSGMGLVVLWLVVISALHSS